MVSGGDWWLAILTDTEKSNVWPWTQIKEVTAEFKTDEEVMDGMVKWEEKGIIGVADQRWSRKISTDMKVILKQHRGKYTLLKTEKEILRAGLSKQIN